MKINAVLVRGQNHHEVLPLLEWSMERGVSLRFIEYMPLDAPGQWAKASVVDEAEIVSTIRSKYSIEKAERGHEPATPYLVDRSFKLGIVSTISSPFCSTCDRLRITATGELYTCLFSRSGTDLGALLRGGAGDDALEATIRHAVWNKQAGYVDLKGPVERPIVMHALGG